MSETDGRERRVERLQPWEPPFEPPEGATEPHPSKPRECRTIEQTPCELCNPASAIGLHP